jgi:seryl-tRNA synthetase
MLDLKFIRQNPDLVKEGIEKKNELDALPLVDELLELDKRNRKLLSEIESLRAKQKKLAKAVGAAKGKGENAADLLQKSAELSEYLKGLEAEQKELEERIQNILAQIPNVPHPSVPVGKSEADNVVVKEWGEKPKVKKRLSLEMVMKDILEKVF